MFLDGTLRYTDDFCESFSSYIRIVFYKLKNNIYRFISIFLTTFLTTPFSNVIRTNINTFYLINIKLWQSKNETVPWGRETALIYKKNRSRNLRLLFLEILLLVKCFAKFCRNNLNTIGQRLLAPDAVE